MKNWLSPWCLISSVWPRKNNEHLRSAVAERDSPPESAAVLAEVTNERFNIDYPYSFLDPLSFGSWYPLPKRTLIGGGNHQKVLCGGMMINNDECVWPLWCESYGYFSRVRGACQLLHTLAESRCSKDVSGRTCGKLICESFSKKIQITSKSPIALLSSLFICVHTVPGNIQI